MNGETDELVKVTLINEFLLTVGPGQNEWRKKNRNYTPKEFIHLPVMEPKKITPTEAAGPSCCDSNASIACHK